MFGGSVVAKLNLSGWKFGESSIISNTGGSTLFSQNKSKEIIAKNWDISKINDLTCLFSDCSSLETLDISNWAFGSNHLARAFFQGCKSLTNVKGIQEWQLSSFNLNQNPFSAICNGCTALSNKLTGGMWNNGTWSNGTFTPST